MYQVANAKASSSEPGKRSPEMSRSRGSPDIFCATDLEQNSVPEELKKQAGWKLQPF
jgi:hypothetical protein